MPNCPLTLRLVKGSKLTFAELDQNFISLRNCINNVESYVNDNFLSLSGGSLNGPLSACTGGVYTNDLYSCSNMLTVWSDITIEGNVVINGSATTINTEVIQSLDNNIILNYSGTSSTAVGGGITVQDAQGTGVDSSIFVDSNGVWNFNPSLSANTGTIDNLFVTTIGGPADCVNDLYVSNIHSCSPLNINPLDEGNVYFGSTSGITVDVINSRIGIGTNSPTEKLDVSGNTKISGTLNIGNILGNPPIINLGLDSNGFVVTGVTETNLGNVLFVSESGNDLTAQKGDLHYPWQNIYSAKSAATSGDIIYVFPGTWVYDNRNSAGNPFNGQINTKVNLWKNGVTYYFSPGSKIVFYNQTVTGQIMYLFNPLNTLGETCTVLGDLEWEGNSTGADSSNGHPTFLWLDNSGDSGFTFHAEFKKLTSYACEPIRVNRNVTLSDSYPTNITLIGDEIYRQYLGGQTGAAAVEFYNGSDAPLNLTSKIRKRSNIGGVLWYFQLSGDHIRTVMNINGDQMLNTSSGRVCWLRNLSGTINMDIKKIYHGTGQVFDTLGTGGWTLNLKGDVIDNVSNGSSTNGVFWITSPGNVVNYYGNVTTNIGSGVGRYVAGGVGNNTYNINGDIRYLGTGTTTNVVFYPQNNGTVNYTGNISGNYAGGIAQTLNGTVNINNSYIKSTVDSTSSRLFFNGTTTQGYFRLNNSYVELKNNTNPLSNGSYINAFINNSTIINSGSGDTLSNTTNFGNTQIVNSTLISSYSGATSILNTGTAPVISSNVTVNTPYNILDIRGNITTLIDLIY
jgi:hypothetical protein